MDPALYQPEIRIPNMIMQPYVENAIKHGIIPKKGHGNITISGTALDKNLIKILIEDNGVGLSYNKDINTLHHSISMKLTDERLTLMQQMHNKLYEVHAEELTDAEGNVLGTRIEIVLSVDAEVIEHSMDIQG
jgi:LytS/YehU family sensor histidine kinase